LLPIELIAWEAGRDSVTYVEAKRGRTPVRTARAMAAARAARHYP